MERFYIWTSLPGAFFETVYSHKPSPTAYLKSAKVGPRLVRIQEQIEEILTKDTQARVFFGPHIEFAYMAFRIPSPRGLPIWWVPGVSYSVDQLPDVIRAWNKNNFDVVCLLKHDATRMPDSIMADLNQHYVPTDRYPDITVLYRRDYWMDKIEH
jgi:hypothetical protein